MQVGSTSYNVLIVNTICSWQTQNPRVKKSQKSGDSQKMVIYIAINAILASCESQYFVYLTIEGETNQKWLPQH